MASGVSLDVCILQLYSVITLGHVAGSKPARYRYDQQEEFRPGDQEHPCVARHGNDPPSQFDQRRIVSIPVAAFAAI